MCSSDSKDSWICWTQTSHLWLWDPLKLGFRLPSVVRSLAATCFHQFLIVDLVLTNTCWVRRYRNLSNLIGLTHKSSKSSKNVLRVFLLYQVVMDWNPKRFHRLGVDLNSAKLTYLRFLIGRASQNLNSPFCSLNVLESWFVQSWAMSNT